MTRAYEETTTRFHSQELGACALVQDLLPLYLEGEVSPGSRDLITEHLARCERCAGFLAGAQSMRVQLRRDQVQHANTLKADAPRRGAMLRLRDVLATVAALLLCLPGGAAAGLVGAGLGQGDVEELLGGLVIASIICTLLLGLARVVGPINKARVSAILGGCALGGAGVITLMIGVESRGAPLAVIAGFAVGVAGLISVWSGVARDGNLPFVSAP